MGTLQAPTEPIKSPGFLLVPEGFDPHEVLPPGLWEYADGVMLFMHVLVTSSRESGWTEPITDEEGAILMGGSLEVWRKVRAVLIEKGVIECGERRRDGRIELVVA